MRKTLAIILVLVLALSLFAGCAEKGDTSSPAASSAAPASSSAPASAPAGTSAAPATFDPAAIPTDFTAASHFGFFNANLDYSKMNLKPYKFAFLSPAWDEMTQRMENNFEAWAKAYGSTCTSTSSDGDMDKLLSNIELFCTQDYDGLLLNVFKDQMIRVNEICTENEMPWFSVSEIPRDVNGVLYGPYVITNGINWGYDLVKQEIEYMKANVKDFDPAKTMIVCMSLTTIKEFSDRSDGCTKAAKELAPEAKYEVADGVAEGGYDANTGYNMAATRFTANPDIKFWIYAPVFDNFTAGVLRFTEEKSLANTSVLASLGGDQLGPLLKAGTNGAWKFSLNGDLSVRWNPCFNALYAAVAGWCSYENLWPDLPREGTDKYAGLQVAWARVDETTYDQYQAWCDHFAGLKNYPEVTYSGVDFPVLESEMKK
jgi:ABC-type sugar transport system substrate-binding protein